jgi:hypothetical protein
MFTNQAINSKRSSEVANCLTAIVLVAAIFVVASCGGGGGATLPGPQITNQPAAGTADLSGQLIQAGGERVVSAAGSGLPGVFVTLIDTLTGGKIGTDITDNLGKFEFKGVPSGDNYLIKLEFKTSQDLDGDGRLDEIELFFPVSLADQAVTQLLEEIGVTDSNGDGVLDALEVEIQLTDDNGRIEMSSSQHRRRDGETRIDSNGNGSFDDEPSLSDSDSDGLVDAPSPAASSGGNGEAMELEVRGVIEQLTEATITVGGVTFGLNAGTEWKINDQHVSQGEFSEGMFVKVEGFPNGSGGWTAHEVEDENSNSGGSDDGSESGSEREVRGTIEALSADSITVGGVTFALTAGTEWEINDVDASPADFSVGMFVKAEGFSDGNGGWIAHEVETEDPAFSGSGDDDESDDDESDDDNSGSDDDESDDDNSGSDDDESGDDNSGSDDDESGDDEDDEGDEDESDDDDEDEDDDESDDEEEDEDDM